MPLYLPHVIVLDQRSRGWAVHGNLLATEFVGLAVVEGQTKDVELPLLAHLELNESVRPWSLICGACCEGTVRHKPCCKDSVASGSARFRRSPAFPVCH
jgi:hypothetical protein